MEYISFDKNEIARGRSRVVGINKPKHFLALYNCNIHWIVPKTGTKIKDIPNSTQFLLWQTAEGNYGVALPLICGDLKASVCGCNDGLCVTIKGTMEGEEPDNAELLYIDYGKDPYQLTLNAVKNISERLQSFNLRTEKNIPKFLDYIGWCTWDAFYGAVDEEKVIMGLDSFKKADFPLRYMILDDGSWNAHYEYLNTASVSESKFPDGLHSLIDKAKNEYGLKMFGVWHCFTAYWCGINPNGELAKKYNYVKSYADIRPWIEEDTSQDCYVITPEDIGAFYDELHSYLHAEGADMLKIDGQSSLDLFTDGIVGQGTAMKKYQQAMQETAKKYFDSRVIHCMSNSIDIASVIFKDYDKEYADELLEAAEKGWTYISENPSVYVKTTYSGEMNGSSMFWASSCLYYATGKEEYHNYFLEKAENNYQSLKSGANGHSVSNMGIYGYYTYLLCENRDAETTAVIEKKFKSWKKSIIKRYEENPWNIAINEWSFWWGSFNIILGNSQDMYIGNYLLGLDNEEYHVTQDALNFILGINAMRKSYITGTGEDCIKCTFSNIYNGNSPDGVPAGYMPGGLNSSNGSIISKFPLKCYIDDPGDWFTNENAIYWNAVMVFNTVALS